jgi:hypothetical protein
MIGQKGSNKSDIHHISFPLSAANLIEISFLAQIAADKQLNRDSSSDSISQFVPRFY